MEKKKNIWTFFLENWQFSYVIIMATLIMGISAAITLPKESDPDVEIPIVVVTTAFPGASAEDVEEFVTDPIEDKLLSIEDVDDITSTSSQGISSIVVNFDVDTDVDEAFDRVNERVDLAKVDLAENAEDPFVQKVSFDDVPVLVVSLAGPFSVPELNTYAEEVAEELERVAGVSEVEVTGGQDREVIVNVDKAALDKFQLSLSQVTSAIQTANSTTPIGTVKASGENFAIRLDGGLEDAREIETLPITSIAGAPVLVRDVAEVVDTFSSKTSISRLSIDGQETQASVSLSVFKISGGNVITTVDEVWMQIETLKQNQLPEEVTFVTVEDNAEVIREDLADLSVNGSQTVLIVFLLLMLFLGWREAMLAGIGIPLTFLITFGVLQQLGYSLNFLTLFSLILSLGIIVDAAIVMTEGIHQQREKGLPAKEAAAQAIHEFSVPLIAGTLTTIFAFLPMMMTSGIIGKYIESIPVTVTIVLLASLFVALAIIPTIASRWLKKPQAQKPPSRLKRRVAAGVEWVKETYAHILDIFLTSKKKRRRLVGGLIGLFFVALSLPVIGVVKVEMFTDEDMTSIYFNVDESYGTPLEITDASLGDLEALLMNDERIESFLIQVGSGSESDSNSATITANLADERSDTSGEIVAEYTQTLNELGLIQVTVNQLASGPGDPSPVEVRVTGPDLTGVQELSAEVRAFLETLSTTQNVDDSIEDTNGEFVLTIDRAKASAYGTSSTEIARTLRNAVYGSTATTLQSGQDDVDVVVKYDLDPINDAYDQNEELSVSAIEGITLTTRTGEIPLSSLVTVGFAGSQASIDHLDGDRVVYVTSDTAQEVSASEVFTSLAEELRGWDLEPGYDIILGGEQEDIQRSFTDMLIAMMLGLVLIAALLIWQFGSFKQPFYVLVTVPLALIGVLPGLGLVGQPLSFPGLIGIVALTGIVVNNAIILIDRININREAGMMKREAVREAAQSRLQPILLTTLTTVTGLTPLAISSATWGPLGYSIIFGLSFSTVLTLLVVPLLYLRFEKPDSEQPQPTLV
jgi:multidrug efflux pump subunit AcrB